jgi:hypothetical protein
MINLKLVKNLTLSAALAAGMLLTGGLVLSGDNGLGSTPANASSEFSTTSKEFIGRDKSRWGRPLFVKKHRHWRRHKWSWRHRFHKRWRHHKWSWDHKWDTSPPNQGISKPDLGIGDKPVLGMPR